MVERLAQGCSARPRKTRPRRGKEEEKEDSIGGATEEMPTGERRSNRYMDVQVGDIIRVQTNLGWESVTVRAKRQGTGKIDIQFKDGEYMRSVMPRLLRNSEGHAVKESQELPSALPPPWPPRSSQSHGGAPLAAPQMAPVPTSTTGAVPQKLAGYKGGLPSGAARAGGGHPLAADEATPRETQDALAGAIMEGCSVELRETQTGLPSTSASAGRQRVTPAAKAPAARLKQQLQQLISSRPIVVPKVTRSSAVNEPLLGCGLIGSAVKVDPKNGSRTQGPSAAN